MKIIFDSDKQKEKFILELTDFCSCPRQFGLDDAYNHNGCHSIECEECWERAIECEVNHE